MCKSTRMRMDTRTRTRACAHKYTHSLTHAHGSRTQVIVFNLKRFSFDWDRQLELKTNRYFEFPERIDLGRYTVQGLEARCARDVRVACRGMCR